MLNIFSKICIAVYYVLVVYQFAICSSSAVDNVICEVAFSLDCTKTKSRSEDIYEVLLDGLIG